MYQYVKYCSIILLISSVTRGNQTDYDLTESSNRFTFELFNAVYNSSKNVLISPHVVFLLINILSHVASEETAAEIKRSLLLPDDEQLIALHLRRYVPVRHDGLDMKINLYLYCNHSLLNPQFIEPLVNKYGVIIHSFARPTKPIDLSFVNTIDLGTEMIVNLAWQSRFSQFSKGIFHFIDGDHIMPMMQQSLEVPFLETDEYEAVELPYTSDSNLSMVIIMPKHNNSEQVMQNFTIEDYKYLDSNLRESTIHLKMPRFSARHSGCLKNAIARLGMNTLFEMGSFNVLRDIATNIYELEHFSEIRVDSTGTRFENTNYAPIAVAFSASNVPTAPQNVRFVMINRPFLYLIRNRQDKEIISIGQLVVNEFDVRVGCSH